MTFYGVATGDSNARSKDIDQVFFLGIGLLGNCFYFAQPGSRAKHRDLQSHGARRLEPSEPRKLGTTLLQLEQSPFFAPFRAQRDQSEPRAGACGQGRERPRLLGQAPHEASTAPFRARLRFASSSRFVRCRATSLDRLLTRAARKEPHHR